jgi:RNAse (barnase) inhibitor barstar
MIQVFKKLITINGKDIQSTDDVIRVFINIFGFHEGSLKNWNVFWDELGGIDTNVRIVFINTGSLRKRMGEDDFKILRELMMDFQKEAKEFEFMFDDQ